MGARSNVYLGYILVLSHLLVGCLNATNRRVLGFSAYRVCANV